MAGAVIQTGPTPVVERAERGVVRYLLSKPLVVLGLVIVAVFVLAAVFAPLLGQYGVNEQLMQGLTAQGAPLSPSWHFLLGTDLLGRDLLTRMLYGARITLFIGIVGNAISISIGTTIGLVAGYFGGMVESLLMRFIDLVMSFPAVILAICLALLFSPSLWIVIIVVALVNWVQVARVVYTATRSLVTQQFIEAERAIGASNKRILLRHVLPHLVSPVVVYGTLGISTTVLLAATLSFLGVGVQPPTPSWGNIIFENETYLQSAPWLVYFPGASILLLALGFNLVGDGLRDALDPTRRGESS